MLCAVDTVVHESLLSAGKSIGCFILSDDSVPGLNEHQLHECLEVIGLSSGKSSQYRLLSLSCKDIMARPKL